jgi:hypothetical protein
MSSERLTPVAAPGARIVLFETQPPLTPDGVTIERYTTSQHTIFEKHINADGVEHWFLLTKQNELP